MATPNAPIEGREPEPPADSLAVTLMSPIWSGLMSRIAVVLLIGVVCLGQVWFYNRVGSAC